MTIIDAIQILNKYHHGFERPSIKWRWVQYNDFGYISGATLTTNKTSEFAGDSDSRDDCWYSDFEIIAIAEKYVRDQKMGND